MIILHSFLKQNKYKPVLVSFLIFSGILLFSVLTQKGRPLWPGFIVAIFYAFISYMIFLTRKITLFRKITFVAIAVFFVSGFKIILGSMPYFPGPACPVALSSTSLSIVRDAASNIHNWIFFITAIIWAALIFFSGRLWCSWICWFGGLDECFSSMPAKKKMELKGFKDLFSELPSAILLFTMLATFSTGTAVFCLWICPLKITPSFLDASNFKTIQTVIYVVIGIVFIVLIPLFSKKRSFCRFICPLRGFFRWTSGIHPLKIKIDLIKCDKCGKCIPKCSSMAIDEDYNISPYCNFCLECFEVCKMEAIETDPGIPTILFISLLLSGIVSSLLFISFVKAF